MIPLLFAVLLTSTPEQAMVEKDAEERQQVAWMAFEPKGQAAALGRRQLLRSARAAFERHTDLTVTDAPPSSRAEVEGCEPLAQMTCWVLALSNQPNARFLLVTSLYRAPSGADRLSILFIDVVRARMLTAKHGGATEASEAAIDREASVPAHTTELASEQDLAEHFEAVVASELRPFLEARGHVGQPFGMVEIEGEPGLDVALEGRIVAVSALKTVLRGVREGRRTVRLTKADGSAQQFEINVERGRTAYLRSLAAPQRVTRADAAFLRPVTAWSGIAVAVAGASLVTWALAANPGPPVLDACVGPDCRAHRSFASLCELTSKEASCLESEGVLAAPLGIGLALAGAAWWSGSTFLEEDTWTTRLLVIGAGLAIGGLTYGLSAAASDARTTSP